MKTPLTYDETWGLIYDAKGAEVAACHSNKQDAADIVRICNAHADLVAACGGLLRTLEIALERSEGDLLGIHHNAGMDVMIFAETALAKAKGPA